ncbi:unnamed protein product [Nippostrongylus brasiliensis]|uniref:SCP domain-containing protein n=1 Tax=Nippostrongylus brasiliensis TaxID=27835 RepID=A0A0N4YR13_NIPBR|nr:unnamed protein product [Nippostrongylus brasiliensis]
MRSLYLLSVMFMGAAASPAVTNNMCANYPEAKLDDDTRTTFTEGHNRFRAAVANGYAYVGQYGFSQYAEDMEAMEWSCTEEGNAIKLAEEKCTKQPTAPKGFRMNTALVDKAGKTSDKAIEEALGKWRNEIMRHGMPEDLVFTAEWKNKIGHATKMIWHSSSKLACAYADCKDKYSIVCLYSPKSNMIGKPIYKKADEWAFICTGCPKDKKCGDELDKLCYPPWALP